MSRKVLVITKNFKAAGGKRLGQGFAASLLSKIAQHGDFEVFVLSSDHILHGNDAENKLKVTRVPSQLVPKGMSASQFYTELWLGKTRISLPRDILQRSVDFARIVKEANKMLPKVEIIHWLDLFSPLISLFNFFSKLYGIKSYVSYFSLLKRYPLNYQLLKASFYGFDRVIASTFALGDSLSQRVGLPSNQIQHIPLGVDLGLYKPALSKDKLKEAKGIKADCKVISWFGPIENCVSNDFYYLLNSVSYIQGHLPSTLFVFAFKDEVPPPYMPPTENVRFCNNLENIREILDITDIVVLPFSSKIWQVGLPLTIIEALASGVPVITMKHPGIDEAIIDGFNGILIERLEDFPQAIIGLCQQKDRLEEMSQKARAIAEDKFDINKTAQAYIDLWSV